MSRRIVTVACASALICALMPRPAGAVTTFIVNNGVACDDTTTDSTVTPYCTIQAAVDNAFPGDVVEVRAGIYTGSGASPVVTINKDLTIDGAGEGVTIIDGQDFRRGVSVGGFTVGITDLTVRQGFAGIGGNVDLIGSGGELDIARVTIADGTALEGGGLFVGAGTTADLVDVTFTGNAGTATIGAGGGGAITVQAATVTITDSFFTLNTAVAHGAAIGMNYAATVTITDSFFTLNTAIGAGGAIWGHNPGLTVDIFGTGFVGNESGWDGGAVEFEDGTFRIEGAAFLSNTAGSYGGGLSYLGSDDLVVVNATFFDNEATVNNGGGAYANGFFVNTTFFENSAGGAGGGLSKSIDGQPNVANSVFAHNTADGLGDECFQITSEGHNLVLSDSVVPGEECVVDGDTVGNIVGVDPLLGEPIDVGGPTPLIPISLASPLRDAGNPDAPDPTDWDAGGDAGAGDWSCAPADQRGADRTGRCDIGAHELDRVIRLAGGDRYATAAAISAEHFPQGAARVFIATGLNFPDALAVAAWANLTNQPLLLVNSSGVPAATAAELTRLLSFGAFPITIIGGTTAIPASVETALQAYGSTERISGNNRYLTAIAISQGMFPSGDSQAVIIATGLNFPDALAAAAGSGPLNAPLLLVPGTASDLPQSVADEVLRLSPEKIVVLGGTAAVSAGIFADLDALQGGDSTVRVFGSDRYATAIAFSEHVFVDGTELAYVATGLNFPDALAGAAAAIDSPLLLVPGTGSTVPQAVEDEMIDLEAADLGTAVILGGTGVVSSGIESDLDGIFAN